jgi:hypothetical protein
MTSGAVLGATTIWPPAAATFSTEPGCSTVPPPVTIRSPNSRATRRMLSMGSGELSGVSMPRIPAA